MGTYWLLKLLLLNGATFYSHSRKVPDIVCYLYIVYEAIVFQCVHSKSSESLFFMLSCGVHLAHAQSCCYIFFIVIRDKIF